MNKQKGQMMVEALIALGVAVIIIAAITSMIISALSNAIAAKNQDLATQYARQGMEVIRNISKTNWNYFKDLDGKYCLKQGSTVNLDPYDPAYPKQDGCDKNMGIFSRRVQVDPGSSSGCQDSVNVTVSAYWSDNKCTNSENLLCHSVKLESCFSDVNNISQ